MGRGFFSSYIGHVVLIIAWYSASSLNGIFGKRLLQLFPYPTTLTICQLLILNGILPVLMSLSRQRKRRLSYLQYVRFILPLAGLKIVTSLSSHVSLLVVPVAYTHTVKAVLPIFVVFLSRIFLGIRSSFLIHCSLIPIVLGVFISSVTEIEFSLLGLLSALFSTMAFASQNIYSKIVMGRHNVDHLSLLLLVSQASLFMLLPIWIVLDGEAFWGITVIGAQDVDSIALYLLGDGLCNAIQTIAAFTFLSFVTPVTYSIANVGKRIAVIALAIVILQNDVTFTNVFGMCLAISGVALYQWVKLGEEHYDKHKASHQNSSVKLAMGQHVLPITVHYSKEDAHGSATRTSGQSPLKNL